MFVKVAGSEEVVRSSARDVGLSSAGRWVENQKVVVHLLVHLHDSGFVAAPVTIVRRTKDCYNLFILSPIKSLIFEMLPCANLLSLRADGRELSFSVRSSI
jgi:hypothetical protein